MTTVGHALPPFSPSREEFRRSGLAHLLAASGQNVMLLAALTLPLLGVVGLGLRARLAVVLVIGSNVPPSKGLRGTSAPRVRSTSATAGTLYG